MANDPQHTRQLAAFDTDDYLTDAIRELAAATTPAVEATGQFSVTTLFEVLSHPGQRYILTYLLQSEGYVTCTELVDHVMDVTDNSMTDTEFRERITTELTHSYLPKLQREGLIDYNVERQIVSPTEATPVVRPYLRLGLAQQRVADMSE